MDDVLPVKFAWGVFCRRTITDKETGELSIIDVVPALKVEQINPPNLDVNNPKLLIGLGRMYVTALFQRVGNSDAEINEDLIVEFLQPDSEVIYVNAKITIRSLEISAFINLNLGELILNVSSLQEFYDRKFEVAYKVRNQELGKILLPVDIKFQSQLLETL